MGLLDTFRSFVQPVSLAELTHKRVQRCMRVSLRIGDEPSSTRARVIVPQNAPIGPTADSILSAADIGVELYEFRPKPQHSAPWQALVLPRTEARVPNR